ncbi:MAG: HAD family hydrolase [Acidobacteria bacterium]|nr:HAD family hydrolase [Acidobacteriota bacterium]
MIRALFLDVGNTLMFCEVDPILRLLEEENIPATASAVVEAERGGRRKLDSVVIPVLRNGGTPDYPNRLFWECYFSVLMNELRVPADRRREITEKIDRHMNNPATWSHIEPDTFDVLEGLRREGYLLGVISNSNGTIERHLASHNLRDYFRFVVDSGVIGKEKPAREIFEAGCARAGVRPEETAYVGDIYSVDVLGAERAGLTGILIDHWGAYPDPPCRRITRLSELSRTLADLNR